jgi:hypothetical protein
VDDEVERLRAAFARYPRRAVLDGCPHCRGRVPVDEHDLFPLTISLGNTVGTRDDVKSLLPLLLERLITDGRLDAGIVLSKLATQQWRTWPATEQDAVDRYLDAAWRSLLTTYPSRLGAFPDAATFLDAVRAAGESTDRFLDAWDADDRLPADRHLARLVDDIARPRGPLYAWLSRPAVRDRLYRAFVRDHAQPWADDLARAYDLVST